MKLLGIVMVGLLMTGGALLGGTGAVVDEDVGSPVAPAAMAPARVEAGSAVATVSVFDFGFRDADTDTAVTHIGVGDTVTWVWDQGIHTATEGLGDNVDVTPSGFDSGIKRASDQDRSFSVTFDSVGVYVYVCELHRAMRGTVVVA